MKVTGHCHCGKIAYGAELDPSKVSICHCHDCQTLSGSAYRVSAPVRRERFTLLRGEPRIYVKTADSGNRRAHAFCGDCGAPVYSAAEHDTPAYSLRIGCLDQRDDLPPQRQIWCRSQVPWASDLSQVPRIEGQ